MNDSLFIRLRIAEFVTSTLSKYLRLRIYLGQARPTPLADSQQPQKVGEPWILPQALKRAAKVHANRARWLIKTSADFLIG